MARSSLIQLIDLSEAREVCFRIEAPGRAVAAEQADPAACETIALVPADRVGLVVVDLPHMNPARLQQALRWAVEDHIAGDPAAQHVVPVRRLDDQRLQCMVVLREDMQHWLGRLDRPPSRMLPDAACLPWVAGQVVLTASGDAVLARWGETGFDRIDADMLDVMLPELSAHGELVWLGPGAVPEAIEAVAVVKSGPITGPGPDSPMALFATGLPADHRTGLDLLRGEFAPGDAAGQRRWQRVVAGLAATALVLLLGHAMADYWMLKHQQRQLAGEIEQRVTQMFPEIDVVLRPRAQAERALTELRGVRRDRFIALASSVNGLIAGAEGLRLDAMTFADGSLELRLRAPSLADFEALQRRARAMGLSAALGDVSVRQDTTEARLTISGDAP